jgi:hypothetical protein
VPTFPSNNVRIPAKASFFMLDDPFPCFPPTKERLLRPINTCNKKGVTDLTPHRRLWRDDHQKRVLKKKGEDDDEDVENKS